MFNNKVQQLLLRHESRITINNFLLRRITDSRLGLRTHVSWRNVSHKNILLSSLVYKFFFHMKEVCGSAFPRAHLLYVCRSFCIVINVTDMQGNKVVEVSSFQIWNEDDSEANFIMGYGLIVSLNVSLCIWIPHSVIIRIRTMIFNR